MVCIYVTQRSSRRKPAWPPINSWLVINLKRWFNRLADSLIKKQGGERSCSVAFRVQPWSAPVGSLHESPTQQNPQASTITHVGRDRKTRAEQSRYWTTAVHFESRGGRPRFPHSVSACLPTFLANAPYHGIRRSGEKRSSRIGRMSCHMLCTS